MGFFEFVVILVALGTLAKIVATVFGRAGHRSSREVDQLKQRVKDLEELVNNDVSKRIKQVETIVYDPDFTLNLEIKKALKK